MRTVLITGASRGIGRATALRFASNGDRVAVNYLHSQAQALQLVEEIKDAGGSALACQTDVSDWKAVEQMVQKITDAYGPIDVLVNNAGVSQIKLFTDLTEEDWDRMVNVDLKGVFLCSRLVLPGMIARHSGKIVNVSSIWGVTGASCEVHYSACKAGIIGLTRALAKEVAPSGIQVNCVAPGVIDTEMNQFLQPEEREALQQEIPMERFGDVGEVANAIFYLASRQAEYITGQVLHVNGGMV